MCFNFLLQRDDFRKQPRSKRQRRFLFSTLYFGCSNHDEGHAERAIDGYVQAEIEDAVNGNAT
jgi:hypothetical protein